MPTPVAFPLPVIDENRTIVEPNFNAIFNRPNVMMRDREAVERKLKIMVEGGKQKLMVGLENRRSIEVVKDKSSFQVISDFDYTLSRFEDSRGARCWTTHGVFDHCAMEVDPMLADKFQTLRAKYFPIEFDPKLSLEQKIPYMEEWWNKSHNHIVSARFSKPTIENFVRNSKIILRDQAEVMLQRLHHLGVPLVVFSAGIGNIIEMFLQQKFGQMPANVHIISNMMNFNDKGVVVSFSQPLIHTFCKNSSVIRKEAEFFHEVRGRNNVILLGDSMGDIHMDVGVEKQGPTLKIGFLNSDIDNLLEHYLDAYDVVLVRDQSMAIPDAIVQIIAEGYIKERESSLIS
ncbi:HAD hydrolase, family IE [Oesophagostomum dentatum]|uniref:5'-nucleotidase n=1 Tax=Oesophagostomum dentatum TaxID=61180 RepID=A0A0B1TDG5_OESDE|nr:HAD hydrolase, family IE [Oesophagostomum dentatum]